MIPVFAVVGHPNKGKSSIVATLAEDEESLEFSEKTPEQPKPVETAAVQSD